MAKINIIQPAVVRIEYRQEKSDPFYGTCLWADFDFDTKNYSLQIMSDCGSYSYHWMPTPNSESFFDLCRRFDAGYLIEKLSNKDQVDYESTVENAIRYVSGLDEFILTDDKDELEDEIECCCNEQEVFDCIEKWCNERNIVTDPYETWSCTEKDYSINAKKIIEVYMQYIIPALPKEGA